MKQENEHEIRRKRQGFWAKLGTRWSRFLPKSSKFLAVALFLLLAGALMVWSTATITDTDFKLDGRSQLKSNAQCIVDVDGTADYSDIQSCIDDVSTGGLVFVKDGVYLINSPLILGTSGAGTEIILHGEGSGTIIKANASMNTMLNMTAASYDIVRDLKFDGNHNADSCINTTHSTQTYTQLKFTDLEMVRCGKFGFDMQKNDGNIFTRVYINTVDKSIYGGGSGLFTFVGGGFNGNSSLVTVGSGSVWQFQSSSLAKAQIGGAHKLYLDGTYFEQNSSSFVEGTNANAQLFIQNAFVKQDADLPAINGTFDAVSVSDSYFSTAGTSNNLEITGDLNINGRVYLDNGIDTTNSEWGTLKGDINNTGYKLYSDTLNTGQGNYELYAMDQDVKTSDSVTFTSITQDGNTVIDSGNGVINLKDDLLMHLPLNTNGNAEDYIAHNDGTVSSATWTTTSKYGGAYVFDGNADYIQSPLTMSNTQSFSVSVWVYPQGDLNWATILKEDSGGGTGFFLRLKSGTQDINWYCSGADVISQSTDSLNWNEWNHIAAVMNGTNSILYINNGESDVTTSRDCSISNNLWVGADSGGLDFNGTIDNIKIWNRSLTATEVEADYEGRTNLNPFMRTS